LLGLSHCAFSRSLAARGTCFTTECAAKQKVNLKAIEERHAKHLNRVVSVDACEGTANALQKQGGLTDTEIQDLRVFHGKMVVPPTVGLLFRGVQVGDGCGEKCLFA